jgi:hypothetical protein
MCAEGALLVITKAGTFLDFGIRIVTWIIRILVISHYVYWFPACHYLQDGTTQPKNKII